MQIADRTLEVGSWKLEVGSWKLEVGSWKLEVGSWKLRGSFKDSCVSGINRGQQLNHIEMLNIQLFQFINGPAGSPVWLVEFAKIVADILIFLNPLLLIGL